jgi:hypothetical protein
LACMSARIAGDLVTCVLSLLFADPAAMLANPILSLVLRIALGTYVLYMARGFYADPFAYFRRWMPDMPEFLWIGQLIRAAACFCVWGGCFILATAVATQILGLFGWPIAFALIALAAIATYFLLPAKQWPEAGKNDASNGTQGAGV